ncbi:Striatin family-domain-containing protein [Blyttiomyces helicus]|uniref:Striatin family-domain-containing protein n=1 Tax=Blyttiomyces helicus TaxID=388810 RepID=A0A4P9WIS8_9FUNG|nr:Striatin family-domain-containing protein [Blyttiomyces helicus]|eukprot:RKO92791.1 Striatin family-domain-containing protein [Blyttiomyces helicus]
MAQQGQPAAAPQTPLTAAASPLAGYSIPGVLHFIQIEWRRFERDRNEWEIERADLKARVAFLEGERRGMENVKTDLLRRVKMLEYALRQERYDEAGFTPRSELRKVLPP